MLAAVYHPITKELFTSYRDRGSYLHVLSDIDYTTLDIAQLPSLLVTKFKHRRITCDEIHQPNKERIIDTGSSLPHAEYLNRLQTIVSHKGVENIRDYSAAIYTACKI